MTVTSIFFDSQSHVQRCALRTAARMAIEPARARIDEPVSIRVLGLEPNQTVVLRARMRDEW
jgi:hypothetical protein